MSDGLRTLICLVLAAVLCGVGYAAGYRRAAAEGEAAVTALKAEQSEEKRRAADAYGEALASALETYRQEVAKGDALARALEARDKTHSAETKKLRGQICGGRSRSIFDACGLIVYHRRTTPSVYQYVRDYMRRGEWHHLVPAQNHRPCSQSYSSKLAYFFPDLVLSRN